ncbi:MAG: DUF3109 family protein [Bacteroidota bacterium]|nr:DUF3109 family protein [Bacteroidota bacterium]
MIAIQDKLVSEDIIEEYFICALDQCKGACCWEGDLGAPLQDEELKILDEIYPVIKDLLSVESQDLIENGKGYLYFDELKGFGTRLHRNGPCVYLTYEESGMARCGIEKAWELGRIDFQKPISCHLYPIRVIENKAQGFTAVNYDRWDICSSGCQLGERHKLPLHQFVKKALIRKFGESFYEELEAAALHIQEQKGEL